MRRVRLSENMAWLMGNAVTRPTDDPLFLLGLVLSDFRAENGNTYIEGREIGRPW